MFAHASVVAWRSRNREQTRHIVSSSPLGRQNEKVRTRPQWLSDTIDNAFRDLPPKIEVPDFTGLTANGKPVPIGVVEQQPTPSPSAIVPTLTDAGDWEGKALEPRGWVNVDRVPERHVTLLHSAGGGGKSLLTQQWLTSTALGCKWLGEWASPGIGLFINCEDNEDEAHRRQSPINKYNGHPFSALKGRLYFLTLTGNPNNSLVQFVNGEMVPTDLFHKIKSLIIERGITRVVFDNASNLFPGNENARNEVAPFLALLEGLASETGAAIILIAHDNKLGQSSGSTAWFNQSRMVLKLETLDNGLRRLSVEKSNYGPTGKPIEFFWHNGVFKLQSELPADYAAELAASEQARFEDATFLACLAKAKAENRAVSPSTSASNYAPKIFAAMPTANGVKRSGFEAALQRLLSCGTIRNGERVYQRDNRAWVTGLGLAPTVAPTPAQTLHEGCTELDAEPQFSANENAQSCTHTGPIYKYKDGGSLLGSPPITTDSSNHRAWPSLIRH